MKFTTVFAVLATLATAVSATLSGSPQFNTNAKRMANGLTPLPPVRRHNGTPTHGGKKGHPSGIHHSCNTGSMHCCNTVSEATPEIRDKVNKVAGVLIASSMVVGLECSPLSVLGLSKGTCQQQAVCCEGNKFNGAVVLGCSPVNVNLI